MKMDVSQADRNRFTLEPHVNELVKSTVPQGDSNNHDSIMSPLPGSEKPSVVCIIIGHMHNTLCIWKTQS
jgi:hypothetical protein